MTTFPGTWMCPECGTRYTCDVGRCGDRTRCSRPQVVEVQPVVQVDRNDGLTDNEGVVADALIAAARDYGRLPVEHPSEQAEFAAAIHRCQDLLAIRIARRHYPDGWPVKQVDDMRALLREIADVANGYRPAPAGVSPLEHVHNLAMEQLRS